MVAVTLHGRAFLDVLADMVDGVVIANGLQEPAASRIRRALFDAVSAPNPTSGRSAAA